MGSIININQPNALAVRPTKIIIDTNVLIDLFYSNASIRTKYRARQYQNYINFCVQKKIPLYTTGINIYETFHVIDNINKDLYNSKNGTKLELKEYHKIGSEVKKVHKEFDVIFKSLSAIINIIPHTTSNDHIENYISKSDSSMDFYDIVLLKTAEDEQIKYILTNDSDFISNPEYIKNCNILTQNSTMINSN